MKRPPCPSPPPPHTHAALFACTPPGRHCFDTGRVCRYRAGAAYVVFGRAEGDFAASYDLSSAEVVDGKTASSLLGLRAEDALGVGVGPAGDFNGDGVADVWVRKPEEEVDTHAWEETPSSTRSDVHIFARPNPESSQRAHDGGCSVVPVVRLHLDLAAFEESLGPSEAFLG